jgi:predicted metal-dependent peptidase
MEYVEDKSVGTASIGCKRRIIKYNPDFVKSQNTGKNTTLIAHEVLHYYFLHHIRGIGKDPNDWNKACDYAVNAILRKAGFEMPEGHLYDPKFEDMYAEEIYKIIHKDDEKENQQGDSGNGDGDDNNESDSNAPQNWGKVESPENSDDLAEAEAEAKQDAIEAMNVGKQAGKLPGNLEEKLTELIEPQKNWRELLLKFIAEIAKNDYSWSKPNRRYLPSGLYLPQLESIELGKVVFAIDTSCSVDTKLLSSFVAEIKEAASLFNFPVTVIHCDTAVRKVEELDEDSEIIPVGRGGTSFYPVFDYVNDNLPDTKALVYFTDGECWDKLTEPEYEVLWVIYNNPHYKSDFGEIIHINS